MLKGPLHSLRRTEILFWDLCVSLVYPTIHVSSTLHQVCCHMDVDACYVDCGC